MTKWNHKNMINVNNNAPNFKEIEEEYYKRFLDYIPNPKQEAFHIAGLTAQERWLGGGNRSGKTHGILREVARHLTGIYSEDWKGYRFNEPIHGQAAQVIPAQSESPSDRQATEACPHGGAQTHRVQKPLARRATDCHLFHF